MKWDKPLRVDGLVDLLAQWLKVIVQGEAVPVGEDHLLQSRLGQNPKAPNRGTVNLVQFPTGRLEREREK